MDVSVLFVCTGKASPEFYPLYIL